MIIASLLDSVLAYESFHKNALCFGQRRETVLHFFNTKVIIGPKRHVGQLNESLKEKRRGHT